MSDSPSALPPPHLAPPYGPAPARELVSTEPVIAQPDAWLVPRSWALVVALLAAAGLLSTALLWQKLESIQEELARRSYANALNEKRGVAATELPGRDMKQKIYDEAVVEERDEHGVPRLRG